MIDIQTIGVLIAAASVSIAMIFYTLNLRETARNRKATLTTNLLQTFLSEEGALRLLDLLSMHWDDYDDYMKKYDSSINPENYAKRIAFWNTCDLLGYQYKTGIIDIETLYDVASNWVVAVWVKFKPIIYHYREWEFPSDYLVNFEFLAEELLKIGKSRDEEWEKKMNVVLSTHPRDSIKRF